MARSSQPTPFAAFFAFPGAQPLPSVVMTSGAELDNRKVAGATQQQSWAYGPPDSDLSRCQQRLLR